MKGINIMQEIELEKCQLEKMYKNMKVRKICKELDLTHTTIYNWLHKFGIPLKQSKRVKPRGL